MTTVVLGVMLAVSLTVGAAHAEKKGLLCYKCLHVEGPDAVAIGGEEKDPQCVSGKMNDSYLVTAKQDSEEFRKHPFARMMYEKYAPEPEEQQLSQQGESRKGYLCVMNWVRNSRYFVVDRGISSRYKLGETECEDLTDHRHQRSRCLCKTDKCNNQPAKAPSGHVTSLVTIMGAAFITMNVLAAKI